ncbi:MAG: membrane protein insertase YidC [SAR324 cluster bacterium]|jgi:YidC/Oxa1 family membrane protein insertase|uniref:Membrane protein insertase YidC n=1 Tax=marine metagenome TaxID=408172 RepID=A0A381NER2_9ZZZZ|nr:membrane protein insertase YidC [SAR324 cluster bacterium]MDP7169968.1 membrane protein insertase YidC [SAR324 cluster bacterium]MDP7438928.1 membrane protein insertase YidC [SAR324 cluster bacterium]MDP7583280.1 membrane protein insertase YidC [SAR324 cluster bacterium]|tara:strand:+ start:10 stop:1779 length:1770 start_codon:yes stop_codon:yes gene_type:complete
MDKNTLLAVVLSGAIMVGWYTLFPPPEPPPREVVNTVDQTLTEHNSASSRTETAETGYSDSTLSTAAPLASIAEVGSSLPSKEVSIETDNYRLVLDTRGGIAKSLQLKHFKHTKPRLTLSTWFPMLTSFIGPDYRDEVTEDNRVQMFGNHLSEVPAFTQEFKNDPKTSALFRNAVFATSAEEIVLDEGEGKVTLTLTSPVLNGLQLIKYFEVTPDSYIINYRVQLINRSNEAQAVEVLYFFGEQRLSDSNGGMSQVSHEGPVFYFDESLQTETTDNIEGELPVTQMKWLGVEDQYFISAAVPMTTVRNGLFRAGAYLSDPQPNVQGERLLSPYFGVALPPTNLQPNLLVESDFRMYYGPKEDEELLKFGHNLVVSHDMTLEILAGPLLDLLRLIYGYVGNYGVAIIILTIIVRLVLFPLTFKGMKSMKRMQQLSPRMKKLQAKYKNNKEKLNKEMMELYRKNRVNPLGGCLPMLLQIPVFFALYSSLSSAVELRHAPFMFWISDLSQPDGLGITPLLMGASMYFQQKLTPQTAMMDSTQAKVMQMLPFIFTIFTFTFPSGLTLYWVTSNVLSIAQQQIINRIKTPEMQD